MISIFQEVEQIRNHRKRGNTFQYWVKSKGYNESQCSWEADTNFVDTDCIREYWARQAPQRETKRRPMKQRKR